MGKLLKLIYRCVACTDELETTKSAIHKRKGKPMSYGDGYSVARSCNHEQAMRAMELREVKELIARREQARKARFRRTGRVDKAYQIPTWRDEITGRIREKNEPFNER